MQNNSWLRLALYSFIGIILLYIILGLVTPAGMYGETNEGMRSSPAATQQSLHHGGSSGMSGGTSNMGMMNMNQQAGNTCGMQPGDTNAMIQRINYLQMQVDQIRQQMGMP